MQGQFILRQVIIQTECYLYASSVQVVKHRISFKLRLAVPSQRESLRFILYLQQV